LDAHQDPDDQAGQGDRGQPAAAVGAGLLADEAVACEGNVIDGRGKADGAAADIDEVPSGQERQSQHSEQDGEAEEDLGDAIGGGPGLQQ
jgi:hypothetical protein